MTRRLTDLPYNGDQCLDLHLVDPPGRPLVVVVHGGGFIWGSKDDRRCSQSAELLTDAGFNCASLNYSLATKADRFAMWPRNLFDVADAIGYLQAQAGTHRYDFTRFAMLGFSAGCCLSNLYAQGGAALLRQYGRDMTVYTPAALVGFYGPYDFTIRQPGRRSESDEVNRFHSPAYWLKHGDHPGVPPVLHIQGTADDIVYPDQHAAFQRDYLAMGHDFTAHVVEGFGHSFAPRDSNADGAQIDLGPVITRFLDRYLDGGGN